MHRRGGRYYETDEPDPLKAARHYAWAGEHAQAIRLATSDVWALINQGQARALSRLLETFTAQQLDMEQWLQVNVARGQVYALFRESKQARESYQVALSQLETMPDTPHRHEFTARVCRGMGDLLRFEAPQEALAWLRRGLSELQGSNDLEEAGLLVDTGMVQMHLGHYPDAQSALEQGLARLPQVPGQLRSSALMTLGMVYFFQGDVERARAHTVQALDMSQQLQDHFQTASILRNMGPIKYAAGDWQGAISDMQHALVLAERLGSEQLKAGLEVNLGAAYINTGDDELAFNHLLNGFNLAHSNNLTRIELIAQIRLADLRIRRREWGAAETSLPAVEQMALDTDAKSELIAIYRVWAEIKLATGEQAAALAYIEKSVNLAEELNEDLDRGESLRVLGQLLLASGQRQQAMKKFEESLLLLNGNDPYESARTRVQLGLMLLSDTSPNQGTILLQESLSIFQALGAKRNQAELEDILRLRLTDKAETGS
jgi:tetratricopeptide (TPR) repeat protein